METAASFIQYYERNSCSSQWLEFNRGLAAELSAGLPPEDLRQLFFRIGQRLANAMPVPPCNTLGDLQAEFNARWSDIDWGFTTLSEDADCVFITHACSPIAVAFGPDATNWSIGFFEGVYQGWFDAQQMPSSLQVQALQSDAQDGPRIGLRLAKAPS